MAPENFDIRENSRQSPSWRPSHGGAALTRGGGRRTALALLEGSSSLSVCINPSRASSRTSSSVSICLIPLEQTHLTRRMKPQTVAAPIKKKKKNWWSSEGKVSAHAKFVWFQLTAGKLQSFHGLRGDGLHGNQRPGDARLFLFFPSSQTGHQLLQLFLHPRPVRRVEARESHHKSEPFRPSLTNNPTGISELGDCAALFPKYRSDFSASAVFFFCFFFPPNKTGQELLERRHTHWRQRRVCSDQG